MLTVHTIPFPDLVAAQGEQDGLIVRAKFSTEAQRLTYVEVSRADGGELDIRSVGAGGDALMLARLVELACRRESR